MTTDIKVCSRCGEDKPLEDYYKQQLAKRAPYCKVCRQVALKARRKRADRYLKERRAAIRAQLNGLKMTLRCVDCGWTPAVDSECWRLHFDHVDPATKTQSQTAAFGTGWSWERIQAEIALCEPRCISCHGLRTQRQRHGIDPYPIPWSRTSPVAPWSSTPSPHPTPQSLPEESQRHG